MIVLVRVSGFQYRRHVAFMVKRHGLPMFFVTYRTLVATHDVAMHDVF